MTACPVKLTELVELLDMMDDRQERIQLLIDVADRFAPAPESIAKRPFPESTRVPQCESEAFMFAEPLPDGSLKFHFVVDNPQGISAMAMATIIDETLSGVPLADVARVDEDVVYKIFGNELSMGKSLGLMAMVQMAKAAAKRQLAALKDGGAEAVQPPKEAT